MPTRLETSPSTYAQHLGNRRSAYTSDAFAIDSQASKIVITGGAGFVGSHLVDRLLSDPDTQVVVLDNLSRGRPENLAQYRSDPRLELVRGDVSHTRTVYEAFAGARVVYHLASASRATDPEVDVATAFATNVVGTFNVLTAALAHSVHRVIFTSSAEVYGRPVSLPVEEGYPLLPVSLEGGMKAAGEALCRIFRNEMGLDVAILRLTRIYGQRDVDSRIAVWVESAEAGRDLGVDEVDEIVDVVWVGQVVDALMRAGTVLRSLPPINVASGTGTSMLGMAKRIVRHASSGSRIRFIPAQPVRLPQFVASVERMREFLGIEPLQDPLGHIEDLLMAPRPVGT